MPISGQRKLPEGLTDSQVLFLTNIFQTGHSGLKLGDLQGGETTILWESAEQTVDENRGRGMNEGRTYV